MEASTSAVPELPARPTGMSSLAGNGMSLPCCLDVREADVNFRCLWRFSRLSISSVPGYMADLCDSTAHAIIKE